jgi:hypothetical protein
MAQKVNIQKTEMLPENSETVVNIQIVKVQTGETPVRHNLSEDFENLPQNVQDAINVISNYTF